MDSRTDFGKIAPAALPAAGVVAEYKYSKQGMDPWPK
jgi:hypothetical protein